MRYYPILLRVAGRRCLVVGGGKVAQQKIGALLSAGAEVTVVAPTITAEIANWARVGRLTLHQREYQSDDLHDVVLAFAATDDEALQACMAREAASAGVLLNVVDRPALCSFIVPAVCQRGDLVVAVSTSGVSPALAKRIRRDLTTMFGPEYETALLILGRLRQRLTSADSPSSERRRIFGALVDSPLLEHLRDGDLGAVDRILAATVGPEVSMASLGVATP